MRNNYKQNHAVFKMNKRGQVAIFVILAIVIVLGVVIFMLYPKIKFAVTDVNPSSYLKDCIEPELKVALLALERQGGYMTPTSYMLYQDEKIQYLCYTSENYKPCTVQQPILVGHFAGELKREIEPKARQCVTDLKEAYEGKGYDVIVRSSDINVSLIPGSVAVEFIAPMTITKESTQTFSKFSVGVKSEIYDLLLTAVSIIQYESTLGDSETLSYINYYPDLRIEKVKRDDGTLYILSNVVTKDEFRFATRSLVWPSGYGLEQL